MCSCMFPKVVPGLDLAGEHWLCIQGQPTIWSQRAPSPSYLLPKVPICLLCYVHYTLSQPFITLLLKGQGGNL